MNTVPALRILLSDAALQALGARLSQVLGQWPHVFVKPLQGGGDADIAFISRDVTGLSTKHRVLPDTHVFYEAMRNAPGLRWVHMHSAGADRPIYQDLMARGVQVSTSSGANAQVVAQTALAGLLALARGFPQLMAAQRAHVWAPLIASGLPRDLAGQTALVIGWGAIGQQLGALLLAFGLRVLVLRRSGAPAGAGLETLNFDGLDAVLPQADWLLLACPLTKQTRSLVDARALARLPAGAHLINVARGEVVDEAALVAALQSGRLAGAYLDVFSHEPLPAMSPLWDLPNVIVTPHSAGFSDGNAQRVETMFLDNLARWLAGQPLLKLAN